MLNGRMRTLVAWQMPLSWMLSSVNSSPDAVQLRGLALSVAGPLELSHIE